MSVVEIRDKIQTKMQKQSFIEFFILFGIIPALVIFPINYLINPNIDPVVHELPIFYFPFGFLAFVIVSMVCSFVGILAIIVILNACIFTRTKFIDSVGLIIKDDHVLYEMAIGIHRYFIKLNRNDKDPRFEELEQQQQRQYDELKEDIVRHDRVIARQNQKIIRLEWENKKLLRERSKTVNTKYDEPKNKTNKFEPKG